MKLEVDITVYKRRISPLRVTLEKITIKLGDKSDHSLSYFPESAINFAKFKRDPGRIIRELNRGADNLRIEPNQGFWSTWASYDYLEVHYVYWIDSGDLMKVRMRKDIKNTVNAWLGTRTVKEYKRNPPKELSQMELRKRMYNGKCKRK